MGWLKWPGVSRGAGIRLDRKLVGLLLLLAVGCVSLAVEGRRARLAWSELPAEAIPARAVAGQTAARTGTVQPQRTESPQREPLDLNRATARELEALPGIGPALTLRILAYRESRGPFRRVEELDQVPGIGPGRLAKLTGLLCVKEEPGDSR